MNRVAIWCLLAVLAAVTLAPPAGAAVDPFYRNRMESGIRAFESGNWDEAARQLRIACFGYLEEPRALVEGLVRLALAESSRGDDEAFRKVFSRIADVEERFSAYRQARLPESLRAPFEQAAARLVSGERLRSVPAFRTLAERAEVVKLASLPPVQRRGELEERLRLEPGRTDLLLELARLELEARRPAAALDALDRLHPSATAWPSAACLRQQAATEAKECARMDLEQPFCVGVLDAVVEFRLECLVEAGRWQEASALLAGLPPASRGKRRVARLERRIGKQAAAAAEETTAAVAPGVAAEAAVASPPADPGPAAAPPAQPALPVDPATLARLRRDLAAATSAEQLEQLRGEAARLAGAHPTSRQAQLLAAEIAYLSSNWQDAVTYFRRAGEMRPDETHLAFYLAVALFETGEAAAAAELLRPIASRIERTRFVSAYIDRILAVGGANAPPGI